MAKHPTRSAGVRATGAADWVRVLTSSSLELGLLSHFFARQKHEFLYSFNYFRFLRFFRYSSSPSSNNAYTL